MTTLSKRFIVCHKSFDPFLQGYFGNSLRVHSLKLSVSFGPSGQKASLTRVKLLQSSKLQYTALYSDGWLNSSESGPRSFNAVIDIQWGV